ncbi:hypothetical protein D9619_004586 [Psilocybe cf. subviscida]|uniref:Uncharacterized protein n=1 Tax=Psilocybe cf. subviscida TaxID=2480587 RepID=A0A8H5BRY9_9AGAR|nr:hypothetical protein D9619_004586 [Psilocybe cf. subviscida]
MPPTESQPTPTEWGAIALVVEASLLIAQEWKLQLHHFGNIIMRLISVYVAYGRSDTLPSPILCRRYFDSVPELAAKFPHGLMAFGVGTLSAGGSQGMAALDGLVAGLELFDHLRLAAVSSGSPPKSFNSHLVHITSTGPDASRHPFWNDRAARDNISWETLPDALKEGNISYTVFSARTISPRYQELHAAVNKEKTAPWFALKSPATALLGFLPKEGSKGGATAQKARAQPAESPKAPPMSTASATPQRDVPVPTSTPSATKNSPAVSSTPIREPAIPSQPQPPAPAPAQTPALPQAQAPPANQQFLAMISQLPNQRLQAEAQKVHASYQALKHRMNEATTSGNTEEVEKLKVEIEKLRPIYEAFSMYLRNKFAASGMLPGGGPPRPEGSLQPPNTNPMPGQPVPPPLAPPFSMAAAGSSLSMGNVPPSVQPNKPPVSAPAARSVSDSTVHPQPPTNISPMLANAQMTNQLQKLVKERSERTWPPSIAGGGTPVQNPMSMAPRPAVPGMLNQPMQPNPMMQMPGAQQQPEKPPNAPTKPQPTPVWQGTLNFKGTSNGTTQELCLYVTAATATPILARPETWPQDMHIVPTPEADISLSDIQRWIITSKAAWVAFNARQYNVPEHSEYAFKSLVQLLTTRKMFATAAWTTPSGGQTSNMFIFPVNGTNLIGACFPITGIPDLPGNIPYPYPPKNPAQARTNHLLHHAFANMSKEHREILEKMPPQQRAQAMQTFAKKLESDRLMLQRQHQHQQQQLQQMAGGSSPFGPGSNAPGANNHVNPSPFGAGAMGMPPGMSRMGNMSMGGGGIGGMMQPPGGIAGGAVAGGMPTNMFQPFMPRNEGGSGHGGA